MFDLGWSKLIVIAIIAIVVVGPKELPPLLRALGKFIAQLRRQADEFRSHFNEAMRDTGLDEIKRDVAGIKEAATSTAYDISRQLDESVKPLADAAADIQRAGDMDRAPTADAPGDPVGSYANGHSAGAAIPEAMPVAVADQAVGEAGPATNGHGEHNGHPSPANMAAGGSKDGIEVPPLPVFPATLAVAEPHKTQG